MKVATETLIADLIERTRQHLNSAEKLKHLSVGALNWKKNPECWSVLE